jgi:hypothetical protein
MYGSEWCKQQHMSLAESSNLPFSMVIGVLFLIKTNLPVHSIEGYYLKCGILYTRIGLEVFLLIEVVLASGALSNCFVGIIYHLTAQDQGSLSLFGSLFESLGISGIANFLIYVHSASLPVYQWNADAC